MKHSHRQKRCPVFAYNLIGVAAAFVGSMALLVFGFTASADMMDGADWPLWRFDAERTAASPHGLPDTLTLHWVRELPAPRRAWPQQPEDGTKLAFDVSYEPVAHEGLLFVPSMVRDRVTAYDMRRGEEQWRFYTDGPVRFAPAAGGGKLYVASDDGYLYCLNARRGTLRWKHRGGPLQRRILGNGRLIDTWAARGGPVLKNGVVYYAAGIWPFMGVFIHALDAETGAVIWTNSSSGAAFLDQAHAGGSFAGAAPQGYLVATDAVLLAPNGRSRPTGYRRATGEFLYLDVSSRPFGRGWAGQGGYAIMAKGGYFHVTGETGRVVDGELLLQVRTPALDGNIVQPGRKKELARWPLIDLAVANEEALVGVAAGVLTAHAHAPERQMRESAPCARNRTAEYHPLRKLWTAELDAHVERIFIQAGARLYGSGAHGAVLAIDLPDNEGEARVSHIGTVEGTIWNMLAAHDRLLVVTRAGRMYCFGPESRAPIVHTLDVRPRVRVEADRDGWPERIEAMLDHAADAKGYALLVGTGDGAVLDALLRRSEFNIIVLEPDEAKAAKLRRDLDDAGLYGARVVVHVGAPDTAALPPYFVTLALVQDMGVAGSEEGAAFVEDLFHALRPYGGTAWLLLPDSMGRDGIDQWVRDSGLEQARLLYAHDLVGLTRVGALPGAGRWTHQNANAANTVVSRDQLRPPLGLLWFGGPSNENVLPRHGRGPIPQVVGGGLFILGPDSLGARDAYTGRLLWEKELPGIGRPYDTTSHQPGADHVGSPYVSQEDGIYVLYDDACLRLNPKTGETIARFTVSDEQGQGEDMPWGFVSVWEELLIGGVDVQYFDRSVPGGNRSWNATSSGRLVVMDRHTGGVRWSRKARAGYRHNAIAAGGGRLYVMDRLSDGALGLLARRGQAAAPPELLAFDIRSGELLWRNQESLFGSWLGYAEGHDLLLQAGRPARNHRQVLEDEPYPAERLSAYCAASGESRWTRAVPYENAPMLRDDMIIVYGKMFDLITGEDKKRPHPLTGEEIPWRFPGSTNCAQSIASENLVTFRRGTASYFDLAADSGVSDIGGIRAGCTPSLVPADGILSAPDYTRTCICAYQLQTSYALVHAPEVEVWASYADVLPPPSQPVRRAGINFGAPGDRRSDAGTLWLAYPEIGTLGGHSVEAPLFFGGRDGTAPEVLPVTVTPEHPGWLRFQRHSALMPSDEMRWVFASGISGAESIRITLASEKSDKPLRYTVRLFFAEPAHVAPGHRRFHVRLQDMEVLHAFDIAQTATAPNAGVVRSFSGIVIDDMLQIDLVAAPDSGYPPILNGVELVAE